VSKSFSFPPIEITQADNQKQIKFKVKETIGIGAVNMNAINKLRKSTRNYYHICY
jgi:hypothetical protein